MMANVENQQARVAELEALVAELEVDNNILKATTVSATERYVNALDDLDDLEVRYRWALGSAWLFGTISVLFAAVGLLHHLGVLQ